MQPYEHNLLCAKNDYLRSTGRLGQLLMHDIYLRITGNEFRRTDSCGHCELELTRWIADRYFESKEQ